MSATVLILGSGGREHALAWACQQSAAVSRVVVAPGNPGMANSGVETAALDLADLDAVCRLADEAACSLVVVGPEGPLVQGAADRLDFRELGHEAGG